MQPLARLNRFFWRYQHLFIPGLICAVASAVFSILVPIVVRHAVDSVPAFVQTFRTYQGTPVESYFYGRFFGTRSEERRVGKEGRSGGRARSSETNKQA